jgi:3-oxoadipate enol-lactonase
MATIKIDETLRMYYQIYDFTDPWLTPQTILLVHGVAESSRVWYGWIPYLAQGFKVVCIDLRGFGKSTVPPEGYRWSMENFARDIRTFINKVGLKKIHLVGAKFGATIAFQFAHDYPETLHSLTVLGPPSFTQQRLNLNDPAKVLREKGLEYWARSTMRNRLGDVSPEMTEWWINLFNGNSQRVVVEVSDLIPTIDLSAFLPGIKVPTLMIGSESEFLAPGDTVKQWHEAMPDCELVVFKTHSYHVAASRANDCASVLLSFLKRRSVAGG